MEQNNNLEINNSFAPIPEPIPELKTGNKGGFDGAKNRFCVEEKLTPVTQMPDFSLKSRGAAEIVDDKKKKKEKTKKSKNKKVSEQPEPELTEQTPGEPKLKAPEKTKQGSKTGLVIFLTVIATTLILTGAFMLYFIMNDKSLTLDSNKDNVSPTVSTGIKADNDFNKFFEQIKGDKKTEDVKSEPAKGYDKKWKGIPLLKQSDKKGSNNAKSAFEKVSESTVAIYCYSDKITKIEDAEGQGTGVVISKDGLIVTNSHVIGNTKTEYKYQIVDTHGRKYTAKVLAYDSRTDIAVVKADVKNLKPAVFCRVSDLKIGDDIISVGNPGGIEFQNTLTKGVVSAKERNLDDSTVGYIQTDAAVNPGNSGGPLCNIYGQVVGLTTAKLNSSMYEGMGFAIPSDTVKSVADDLIKLGYVGDRVRIGIIGTAIDAYDADFYKVPQGIVITEISKGGSLDGTSAKVKDIITSVDGEEAKSFNQVYNTLSGHKPGDKVKIGIYRVDDKNTEKGEKLTIEITLVADKGETQR